MACTALPLLDTCTRFTPEWREATGGWGSVVRGRRKNQQKSMNIWENSVETRGDSSEIADNCPGPD